MRTFEEVKSLVKEEILRHIFVCKIKCQKFGEIGQIAFDASIQDAINNLDNLDEVTTIEIGSGVNHLIDRIQCAYGKEQAAYHNNFELFMKEFIFDSVFVPESIFMLGITMEDLQCLKDTLPTERNYGDELRQRVNAVMKTTIPMAMEEEEAIREYENADDENKDQAFVKMRETQRDSGSLKLFEHLSILNTLANDQEYQEAKNRVSCKNKQLKLSK